MSQKHHLTVLIDEDKIKQRVQALAKQISHTYKNQSIVIVGVLKGSFVFLADLIRRLSIPHTIEFIGVASYAGTQSTGEVRITHDLTGDVKGKHILLVEDIIDTGKTIDYLSRLLKARHPKSLRICCLLSKPEAHQMEHSIDFVGFEISNEFVIGYGLDLDGQYRGLPYIAQVKS